MTSFLSQKATVTKLLIAAELFLVFYLIYSLTKTIYNSYQVDKYIEKFENENRRIALENKQKNEDYLYYTSPEYIDKVAKQSLGLVNPGEDVLILSNSLNEERNFSVLGSTEDVAVAADSGNLSDWWNFFFGG